ncbi:reverse transcriptase domain-containing protein [Tanacetum coccineum]
MSMWIISRGVVLLILLMEYKVLRDFLLHRSSINNSARLSNKFGGFYFSFKFDISGLLHHVITTIAYRIRDKDTSQSKQNLQSSSMTFIHKTLIIPSVLDSCFISSTVSEVKRGEVVYTTSRRMVCEVFCQLEDCSSYINVSESAQDRDGEVNPTHAYYNGSCTSKDTEDPSWSTSFKTRRTQKTSSALEALWKTLFVLYLYLIGTLDVLRLGKRNEGKQRIEIKQYRKKLESSWRMCVDFKDLNKACPKDGYPLPEIDWKVESLCGFPFKCFLDAYKGYHQIQMVKEDKEKTTFITSQGIFCYTKMPFGSTNAGETYQRLVDKAFHKHIGKNLEVYVDDLVIKIHTKDEIVRDIKETFKTLREINMKLNPKKCTFRVEEGMFLGYKVNTKGLKVCPDKMEAVLSLPSLKCFKVVQKLNGKLASLNRFLAKSAEKSLPFFKNLKKCTKNSDFYWTTEAEEAFKQMKQLIAELPMLTALIEKEELIVYLAAAKETVSAVLMTEREAKQMPIYFVSRALRGPEINYTSMEKLVLTLVHAREYAIHYRPRISVKGEILEDFIVERPEEDSPDTPMEVEEELPEPWILFTDGSSCTDGSGAGLILTNPEGMEFTYAQRFRFEATNNEAEYEALISGLRIAEQMGIKNLQANVDSRLVANQVNEIIEGKSISEVEVLAVVEEEGDTRMTPIFKYLAVGTLPVDVKKARVVRRKSWRFVIINGTLHKKSFLGPWLRFRLPGEIISDNGKQFRDDPFEDWCEKLCICQHFAFVKHPQTNGLIERENRSLGEGIKARLDARSKNWIEELPHVLWAHHTMIKSSNGDTLFSLTYGMEAVIPAKIGLSTLRTAEMDLVQNNEALGINLNLLKERREEVAIREAKSKSKMEKYYNSKVQNSSFKLGDLVYRNNDASHAKDTGNLGPKWEGPYEVTEALRNGAYKLRDRDGKQLPRTWNISNLKKCYIHKA